MNSRSGGPRGGRSKPAGKRFSASEGGASGSAKPKAKRIRPTQLRVIGGSMRGRPVIYNGDLSTRPMKDSVRENLFNVLGKCVAGTVAMDVFAGTGVLAIEAISRGAKHAYATELNRPAVQTIRQSAERLGVAERLSVIPGDAFRLMPRIMQQQQDDTPWIVFVCPPYALWDERPESLLSLVRLASDSAPPGSVIVVEADKRWDTAQLPGQPWDIRRYGGTQLAFFEPAMRCGAEG